MKQSEAGAPDANENRPDPGKPPALKADEGTSHPALASNASAADFKKAVKAKHEAPVLGEVLKTTPFADPKIRENFSGAVAAGERNFQVKTAADKELLRQAIAAKLAEKGAQA